MRQPDDQRAERLIGSDHLRGYNAKSSLKHKEWMHFCVFQENLKLLVNFSWFAVSKREIACRLIVIVEGSLGSRSEVIQFLPNQCIYRSGATEFHMGSNSVRLSGSVYEMQLDLPEMNLKARLYLNAQCHPSMTPQTRLGEGTSWIRWLVVPSLAARGWVSVGNNTLAVSNSPGYHDHNWGEFRWGENFGWLWCIMLPADTRFPWALVVSRVTDPAGNQYISQSISVWRGEGLHRLFQADEITSFRSKSPPLIEQCIPKQANLLVPKGIGQASLARIEATAGLDNLTVKLAGGSATRIVLPSEIDPTCVTTITEHFSTVRVQGQIRGENFSWEGPCLVEQTGSWSLC